MPRLFIGTFLTQEDQQRISALQVSNDHLQSLWKRKTNWVRPSKLHVTWLFLGNIEQNLVSKVSSTLHKVMHERRKMKQEDDRGNVIIEFNAPAVWPNSRKARVIVVENKPVPTNVESLARRIRTNFIPFYSEQTELEHNQDFRPHVTLVRLDRRIETPAEKLAFDRVESRIDPGEIKDLSTVLPIRLHVRKICLIESHLADGEYNILDTASLDE